MDRDKIREELNSTGCGFCLAKWTQVTIHLQLGRTHSCHHPDTHRAVEAVFDHRIAIRALDGEWVAVPRTGIHA